MNQRHMDASNGEPALASKGNLSYTGKMISAYAYSVLAQCRGRSVLCIRPAELLADQ